MSDSLKPPLTKIIATVGPGSSQASTIRKLVEAGVSVFRLNFSHGTIDDHAERVAVIRATAAELGRPIAIMGDLQGPKIRLGKIPGETFALEPGSKVIFQRGEFNAKAASDREPPRLACTYPRLVDDVEPGQRVLVNDGAVRMLVVAKRHDELECAVTVGGPISSGKGINLPDSRVTIELLNERDRGHAMWAVEHELDFLALSFVRTATDLHALRQLLGDAPVSIVAKIELPQAVENIDSILEAADGIMVARGDLGVEMDLARVPVIQKQLLAAAQTQGKPCIVATQMLESMVASPNPTRAEVSDVANAIFDGADAVMLSAETAVGKYPVLAVDHMRRIAEQSEAYVASQPASPSPPAKLVQSRYRTAALAHGVWTIAHDLAAKFIVVWSQAGGGARYLSQNNFNIPILAITSDDRAARRMQLLRGVTPLRMPQPDSLAHFTAMVDNYLLETGWAQVGDPCILVAGEPIGAAGVTNSLAIHCIGDRKTGFACR